MLSLDIFSDIKYTRWDTCIRPVVSTCALKHIQSALMKQLLFHRSIERGTKDDTEDGVSRSGSGWSDGAEVLGQNTTAPDPFSRANGKWQLEKSNKAFSAQVCCAINLETTIK